MEKINWDEINRKLNEIQKAIEACDLIFLQSGEDSVDAQISRYGRVNNGYETEEGWRETDWFVEFHTYADKNFLRKHVNDKVSLDYLEEDKMLEQFDRDCSVDLFSNEYFADCWLRYYLGVPGEISLDIMKSHIHSDFAIGCQISL